MARPQKHGDIEHPELFADVIQQNRPVCEGVRVLPVRKAVFHLSETEEVGRRSLEVGCGLRQPLHSPEAQKCGWNVGRGRRRDGDGTDCFCAGYIQPQHLEEC